MLTSSKCLFLLASGLKNQPNDFQHDRNVCNTQKSTQMDPEGFSSYGFNLNRKYAALIYEFKLCAVAEYVEDPHNK